MSSIGLVDATEVAPSSLPITASRAYREAVNAFPWDAHPKAVVHSSGWTWIVAHPITISLVRLSYAESPLGRPNIVPFPFHDGELAWLVVIRNAIVPIRNAHYWGPFAGFAAESVAVFVRTDEPRWGPAITFF